MDGEAGRFVFRYLYTEQLAVRAAEAAGRVVHARMRLMLAVALAAAAFASAGLFVAGQWFYGGAVALLVPVLAYRLFIRGGRAARARYRAAVRALEGDIGWRAEFGEDGFSIIAADAAREFGYAQARCALDDGDQYVLIVGSVGWPIYKNGLVEGDPEAFRDFLSARVTVRSARGFPL